MNLPDLRYSTEHEWVRTESGGVVVVGITEFAAESLGDVVFVELPEVGTELSQFEKMGEIESVKAVSDLYSPISGRVVERNEQIIEKPELVNELPYDAGWMVKVAVSDTSELENLLAPEQYQVFLASQD